MISRKNAINILISVNIVSWLLLLAVNLITLFNWDGFSEFGVPSYLKGLILNIFLTLVFFYHRIRVTERKDETFIELLSGLVLTGCIVVLISLLTRFISLTLGVDFISNDIRIGVLFYNIHIGLVAIFLTKIFFVWKKLILYHKSKGLLTFWYIFEYALLASLLLNFFRIDLTNPVFIISFALLALYGFVLSVNLKWIAYLDFKEKWQGVLLILLIALFCLYIAYTLYDYSDNQSLATDIIYSVYIIALFAFILIYCLFSFLVILFNLPTSSVFEQKLEELLNFQKLTQSLQVGENENHVYETLLEGTFKVTMAEAAWLEITDEAGNTQSFLNKNISHQQSVAVKEWLKHKTENRVLAVPLLKNLKKKGSPNNGALPTYKSVLAVPLLFQGKNYGMLALLKGEKDGFNKENAEIVNIFARVAGVAIENFRLVSNALENERYKEALNIAKKVQRSLLPAQVSTSHAFEIGLFSGTSDEVGGDYYDFYIISDHQMAVIIGDVSGNGTSAAFHMAQLKGVFHSLIEIDLSAGDFLRYANRALSRCLEKNQFITASIFNIDTVNRQIQYARAGHCPTLYFSYNRQEAYYLQDKGLGLAILRSDDYNHHIFMHELHYEPGDAMLLYTDGIVEAKNSLDEEYGYNRLINFMKSNNNLPVQQFIDKLVDEILTFCRNEVLADDYTAILIKFI